MEVTAQKKRGRRPGQKNGEGKTVGLPTTGSIVSPELFAAIQARLRTYDAKAIVERLKDDFSEPIVRNFLKCGYCTDPKLYNGVAAFLNERREAENNLAKDLLGKELEAIETFTKLHESTVPQLKKRLDKLSKLPQ